MQSTMSWPQVLQFLHVNPSADSDRISKDHSKKELTSRIKELEGKVVAIEAVNSELQNKNFMLEACLRKVRGHKEVKNDQPVSKEEIPIPQRKPKSNKAHLSKILCSLGVPELLQSINKDLKQKSCNPLKIQIPQKQQKKLEQSNQQASSYKEQCSLQQHHDGIRDICFIDEKNYMISVSEDSMMKIWGLQKYQEKIECLATVREHSGPIFTSVCKDGILFTGGMEGIIRCWSLPRKIEKGSNQNMRKYLVGSWNNSDEQRLEPIWQLLYHPENKILFSTSSEISIRSYYLEFEENAIIPHSKGSYNYVSHQNEEEEIPTAISLMKDSLYVGYVNKNILVSFDLETKKITREIQFDSDGLISTNKLIQHNNIIIGAFEDSKIRIFDQNSLVHSFDAHHESVMSVCSTHGNPYEIASCGQDGKVKVWDIRKYQQLCSFQAHKKKYDESCHCISGWKGMVASGGADSIIRIYSPHQ